MNPQARHWTALTILAACTVSSGVSFVFYKASLLTQEPFAVGESSWFIAAHNLVPRFTIGVLLLLAFYGGRVLQLTTLEWAQAIFMAVASFVGCLLQADGIQRTTAATTAFLTQFYVILIPLWWALRQRRRPPLSVMLAALMVLAGVAILARVDWQTLRIGRGEAEVLGAAVFFSLLLCSLNWPRFSSNRAERTSAAMFLIEAGLFGVLSLTTVTQRPHLLSPYHSPAWIGLAVLAAVLGTVGPFILINRWQRVVTPTEAGLLYSLGPGFSVLAEFGLPKLLSRWIGISYANQPLTLALGVGGALILCANVFIQVRPPPA